jgi:MFS family permease
MKAQLVRLIGAQICLHACMTGMRLAAPLMALKLGHSSAEVGVLMALFSLTQVFLALPAGRFADRHGLKLPLMIGVLTSSLGALLCVLNPSFPVLCIGALLTGGSAGSTIIALQRHVGRIGKTHADLKLAFSWLSMGPAISNLIGPFFVGLLIDQFGFKVAFVFLSVIPFLAWFGVKNEVSPKANELEEPLEKRRIWDLLANPMLRKLLLVNWFMSSCWDLHTFMVPLLGHERGVSATAIGTVMGVFAICAALIRFVLPVIAERLLEWQIMTAAMVMTAILMGLYPLTNSVVWMAICSGGLGLFLGSVQPMLMSTMHQITPEHRQGEALGLRAMMVNTSSVFMPMLFGAAGTLIGVSGLFWVVSATVGSGARLAWGLRADKNHE